MPSSVETVVVECAALDDIPRITEIYNHAVLHTAATAEWEPNSVEKRLRWFEDNMANGYPVLVAKDETGYVLGWASLNRHKPRFGYNGTTENSVYVAPEAHGR